MNIEILNHSKPIELKDNIGYHVISGTINLFLIKHPAASDVQHKRYFLYSSAEGTTIYGGKADVEGGYYQLTAVSCGEAQIKSFEMDEAHTETQHYLKIKADEIEAKIKEKQEKYIEKKRNEAALLNMAVSVLIDNEHKTIFQQSGSIYFRTCLLAANALDLKIDEPKHFIENKKNSYALMKACFQKTNMKYRGIKLCGAWWKHIGGTIIGFKLNKQPVALIPRGKSRYEMIDLELGSSEPVDEEMAATLQKDAFMIYRPLPDNEICGRDLLRFGFKNISYKDIMIFVLSLISMGLLGMAMPLLTGLTVDWIIPQANLNLLSQIGIIMAAVGGASFMFSMTRGYIMLRIEGKLDVDLQTAIWDRLLNLPLSFFKQFTSAELASRALGITMIRDIISGPVVSMLLTSIYSLLCWLLLFYYKFSLAAVTSLMIGLCIAVNYYITKKGIVYESKINQLTNKLAGLSFQLIKGAVKIQQSGAVERAYYRWVKEQAHKHKAMKNKSIAASMMEAFNGLYMPVSMAIIYYLITKQPAFSIPVGQYIGFNSAYMMFMSAIFSIFSSMHVLSQVLPLYDRGKIILQTKPESKGDKLILEALSGKIAVDHVWFRYSDTGTDILKDISIEIKPGEYIGIVGTSGSGKSTLMRLLLGFETDFKGKITYDDQDINNLDLKELRKNIGVVLQTGKLISDSIFHNIVGTNLQLTIEDAWNAARIAGIDEDIKAMPMGMHTLVMEGAGTISGGQKQRILIARAVANKPSIFFFDEATSALDNITQAKIKQSFDQFSATRIVIAHRLSTIKNCDRIIVLDHGEIKEMGNYEALMKKKGIFYDLAKRQLA